MSSLDFVECSESEWTTLATAYPEANFLQSWQWGEANRLEGHTVFRHKFMRSDAVVGVVQSIVKNARRGRYLEVPGGPLTDWNDTDTVREILSNIVQLAKDQACVFVRIRPQLDHTDLSKLGWKTAPMHLHAEHTSMIDLAPSSEELLVAMRQQTRYEVRRVEKRGITIRHTASAEAVERFIELQKETAKRHGFVPSSPKLLRSYHAAFGDALRIYESYSGATLLTMALVLFWGNEVDYFEAASTPLARKEPGSYGVIWQIIKDAKARGFTRLNLWGIAPTDDPHHRYAGVTTFKRGFGGKDTTYLPAHDYVINKPLYLKNWLIETMRKKRRKL